MTDSPQRFTLVHSLSWDLRAVAIAMGGVAVALPFLVSDGEMGRLQSAAWIIGGLAFIALFVFANSTALTVGGGAMELRQSGLFGRKVENLPLSDIASVDVMPISTRVHGTSYSVAVKLKGRRQLFMGDNHGEKSDAEAEARLFKALAGFPV